MNSNFSCPDTEADVETNHTFCQIYRLNKYMLTNNFYKIARYISIWFEEKDIQ